MLFTASAPLFAGGDPFVSLDEPEGDEYHTPIKVSPTLVVNADFIQVRLAVMNDESDPSIRIADLQKSKDLLTTEFETVRTEGKLKVEGERDESEFRQVVQAPAPSAYERSATGWTLTFLVTVTEYRSKESIDKLIEEKISRVKMPGRVIVRRSGTTLVVRDVEKYREDLLKLLEKEIERVKRVLGSNAKLEIKNAVSPIQIQSLEGTKVRVGLPIVVNVQI